jgi:NAD(P)-dependent dehydrogenase (short-subunit alcohol dehydrogenase family)
MNAGTTGGEEVRDGSPPVGVDLRGRAAVITGGTRGIGLAVGIELGRAGARCYLTHRWGSADPEAVAVRFREVGAAEPRIVEADVSRDDETDRLLEIVAAEHDAVDVLVANAGLAQRIEGLDDYRRSSFLRTLEYSAWPLVEYTQRIRRRFGRCPRRVVAVSSSGPDHFFRGYDYVAASKAVLELFARYLAVHAFDEGTRVNVVRFGTVDTESFDAFFGRGFFDFVRASGIPSDMLLDLEEAGRAVLALCSPLMDGVNGQVITVDKGLGLRGNLLMQYLDRTRPRVRDSAPHGGHSTLPTDRKAP